MIHINEVAIFWNQSNIGSIKLFQHMIMVEE